MASADGHPLGQVSEAWGVLALRDIQVAYASGAVALELSELDILAGHIYAVVGPNGAGKSTLFQVLTGLLQPQRGQLRWQGREVSSRSSDVSPNQLRQHVVFVRQQPLLFRTAVFDNVAYGLKLRGIARQEIVHRVEAALDRVQMMDFAKRPARGLSGGETQRVALARALVLEPQVLLLDEPTANLDVQSTYIVETLIQELQQQPQPDRTLLFTTHDMAQAYRLSDEIIALDQGHLVDRPPENVFRGTLRKEDAATCFDTGHLVVVVPDQHQLATCMAIGPDDIVLSSQPLASSARNSFAGHVVQVSALGPQLDVVVDIGERVHARITRYSYDVLGLTLGGSVYVTFKASAVRLYG